MDYLYKKKKKGTLTQASVFVTASGFIFVDIFEEIILTIKVLSAWLAASL